MSLMASLVTTSRMQHWFNVPIDSYHEFLLLFYCCVLLEMELTTITKDAGLPSLKSHCRPIDKHIGVNYMHHGPVLTVV